MGGLFPGGGDGRSGDGAKASSSSSSSSSSPSTPSSPTPPPPRPAPSPAQDALAGACAGALARVCVGPLDVLKIRFQVQLEPVLGEAAALRAAGSKYRGLGQALKLIVREEGLAGLWRGTVPGLLLTVPYTAVQFVTLQAVKGAAAAKKGRAREREPRAAGGGGGGRGAAEAEDAPSSSSSSSLLSFGAGAVAGAAATVASYPFDLLRTTLAAQGEPKVYRGTLDAARGVLSRSGPRGLYAGLGTTLVEIVPYAALQFGLYDGLTRAADRRARERERERERQRKGAGASAKKSKKAGLSSPEDDVVVVATADAATRFLCGLAAGTAAKLTTHPLDVAKKRYQVAGLARSSAYGARVPAAAAARPLLATLSAVAAKEGIAGLYKGALPSILKAAPQAAVTLAAYEFFAGWIASGV